MRSTAIVRGYILNTKISASGKTQEITINCQQEYFKAYAPINFQWKKGMAIEICGDLRNNYDRENKTSFMFVMVHENVFFHYVREIKLKEKPESKSSEEATQ